MAGNHDITTSSSTTTRWATLAALGAASALVLSGCGAIIENAAEEAIEKAVEADSGEDIELDLDLDGDEASFTIETEEGTVQISGDEDGATYTIDGEEGEESAEFNFGESAELPDCVSSVFDIPGGFDTQSSMVADDFCNVTGYFAGGNAEDLAEDFERQLADAGFTDNSSKSTFATDGQTTVALSGTNAEGTLGNVTVSEQSEFTNTDGDRIEAIVVTFLIGN